MVQGHRILSGFSERPPVRSHAGLRFALTALALMLALYGLIYYPYEASSWPARAMHAYLACLTRAAAFVIGLGDGSVRVASETTIEGAFPLQIVLDCAAIDAQALYLAAVLAFPAPALAKLLGALGGVSALGAINLMRIVTLYFVGVYVPERFDLVHEEVMTLVIVSSTCLAFALWVLWTRRAAAGPGVPPT